MNDFSKLEETRHMFEWFANDPFLAIQNDMAKTLDDRVKGTEIISIKVTGSPEWLVGTKNEENESSKSILTRAGVAFEIEVEAKSLDGQLHLLDGVFSWVGLNFDTMLKHLVWFDLGESIDSHGKDGELLSRVYSDEKKSPI